METMCPACGAPPVAVSAQGCLSAPDLFLRIAEALAAPNHQCLLLVEDAPKDLLVGALRLLPAYAFHSEDQGRALLGPAAGARL